MMLVARQKNVAFMASLANAALPAKVAAADEKIGQLLRAMPDTPSLIKLSGGKIHPSGLQLCADYYEINGVVGLLRGFQAPFDATLAEMAKEENKDQAKPNALAEQAWNLKAFQLLFAHLGAEASGPAADEASRMAATLTPRAVTGDPAGVERLFYSASAAARNSFHKDVLGVWATTLNTTPEQAMAALMQADVATAMYVCSADALDVLHGDVGRGRTPADAQAATVIAAHAAANGLASVSEQITRWSALDVTVDEQLSVRYGRTDLLNYLLNTARDNALVSMGQCRGAGIQCVESVLRFESAELRRDDPDEDKVSVLADYWKASLQAKVMLMLFRGGEVPVLASPHRQDGAGPEAPAPAGGFGGADYRPAAAGTQPQSSANKVASVATAANGVRHLWNQAAGTATSPPLPQGVSATAGALEHMPRLPAGIATVAEEAGKPGAKFFAAVAAALAAGVAALSAAWAAVASAFRRVSAGGAAQPKGEHPQAQPGRRGAVQAGPGTVEPSTEVGRKLAGALNWPSRPPPGPSSPRDRL